jgi:uncharacterized glyoxalase superfamily protein PhnB
MHITATTLSLNVPDPAASAKFAQEQFGFTEAMAADGFVSLAHPDSPLSLAFLRTGMATFKPADKAGSAGEGTIIALTVDDIEKEFTRIAESGAQVATAPETEPWGERYCQFTDPNGIVWQLVQWV